MLASESGKVLLANTPAQRLKLDQDRLRKALDWPMLCKQAHRAGSTAASFSLGSMELEGEVVHLSLDGRDGYLLRLAENDHEASWLRNRSRAAMLMRVAHDLRTPIQSLLATAEKVLDEGEQSTAAEKEQARQQLRQSSELALDHISNVLGVIRGDKSLAGIRPDETFNITEELRSLVMMIGPIARQRKVALKLWLDPHEDTWVHGPVRFVRALFQNIIDNSAKYGGTEVEIGLTCRPLSSPDEQDESVKITLTVKDLGGGLPPEQKARLFEALDQSGKLKERATSGHPSAGLNVLAHALHQLGGKLDLSDRYAQSDKTRSDASNDVIGTVITVTLNLQKGERISPLYDPERALPLQDAPLSGRSIILVEDSPSSRDWLTHILRNAGAQVWAAGNGIEALSLLIRPEIRDRLDLILTDMTLPYMSGLEFAERVRQSEQTPWTGPIVALTAHVADEVVSACHAAGIVEVLEKPIRPSHLRSAILAALNTPSAPAEPAPAPQKPVSNKDDLLNDYIVSDLLSQLGADGAVSFMRRALDEAAGVLSRVREEGSGVDTGRMLHAATGACTLTGLSAVETCLRDMEHAFNNGRSLEACQSHLENALLETRKAIEALT
ncbi:hybrid sensor histidine kinase/response regulator [Roseovarius pacificus]|uniref:hybrid sensor histidine kinase/response regulator n=1 Tax=Roseovarius pacificus TaxID=337701 RepID=UPI001E4D9464|nr:hybrid sensor histidine kinase/response regulator [Roseovarius pacificus]